MAFRQIILILTLGCVSHTGFSQSTITTLSSSEKTTFQTSNPWKPATDVRADVAIVYGTRDRTGLAFEQRVQSWREKGYVVHFMTGIAWGDYQDYFTGMWDGKNHFSEGQVEADGDTIWHGKKVPYIVPTKSFIEYMKQTKIKRVIDAGIDAIYLEEPEFWARAGYSEAFKEAWKQYYGTEWKPQHESPENTYLSNKLKYMMYYRALNEVFTFAKEYGKSKGMNVRCYVPTHSLVNYSAWRIVSPEASLASLPCIDGYIAQVWTGTSREATWYNGVEKERVFENAYLEYGSMESMTAPTGRKMFFLTDPIEDRSRDWVDYKKNYQATFTAQLMYPNIADYEVMPWPDRIYEGLYLNPNTNQKETIPLKYSTQMQVMINSLNQMPVSENKLNGSSGISVLMANSLMFQRFPTHRGYEDPRLSNFYGLTLPFLKRGIPVKTLHFENASYSDTWKDTRILLMTYSNMKPMDAGSHGFIADWVKKGGILVFCGRDNDPFQTVTEWWNTNGNKFKTPSEHLFLELGLQLSPAEGEYRCGKGVVCVLRQDPKEFVMNADGDAAFFKKVDDLYSNKSKAGILILKNYFHIVRGPFEMAAVMDESVNDVPFVLKGLFVDLFDPDLPVVTKKTVNPDEQTYLLNINRLKDTSLPTVLAAAARISDEKTEKKQYSFLAKAPSKTTNVMRVLLPAEPVNIEFAGNLNRPVANASYLWDKQSNTCLISFENDPDGVKVNFLW